MTNPLRPQRRWRMLAIAATACAMLLAAAWAASMRWEVGHYGARPSSWWIHTRVECGIVGLRASRGSRWSVNSWYIDAANDPNASRWPSWWSDPIGMWELVLPLWIPTAACTFAAAALWRIDTLHRRRLRTNRCPACTYDRAGLPAAAPCPECGAAPAPVAPSSR
ncbi:MAG: hypothetical protein K2Q20_03695 [Phycisphaerales bacterium]|nr:hypothetical protein [Phycisphaerales bacterium]